MKNLFLFGCFIFGTLVHAAECNNPMLHRNQQPMSGIFLELTPLTPCTLESGFYQIETMFQASNTIIIDPPGELSASRMILDHERWEQTLVFRIGTGLKTDFGLTLRYVEEGPGNWDNILREYHHIIGLPYEARKSQQNVEYRYWQYNPDTKEKIETTAPQRGIGDMVLSFRHELGKIKIWENPIRWGWRIESKQPSRSDLPTISSGNSDVGLGLLASTSGNISGFTTAFWLNIGAVRPGNTKHKVYPQKPNFFSGGTGMNVDLSNTWNAAVQILGASARYEVPASVRGLNHRQTILVIGLRHLIGSQSFSLGFTEDIDYYSSEDISLLIGWQFSG
jgi:hypothetical protein